MKPYPDILSESQVVVMDRLGYLTDNGFYLGGGTALALQLGHRTSLDFDFYSPKKFDNRVLAQELNTVFAGTSDTDMPLAQLKDTFQGKIQGVNVSGFYYPYVLVGELVDLAPLKLASLQDIAAMKVAAVIQRGKQRDFIDIYYLIDAWC